MKIFAPCMQCQVELGCPSFEPIIGIITMMASHTSPVPPATKPLILYKSSKFEVLLEAGAAALLEGFTFEACASFSAALEQFYEIALRVVYACLGCCWLLLGADGAVVYRRPDSSERVSRGRRPGEAPR